LPSHLRLELGLDDCQSYDAQTGLLDPDHRRPYQFHSKSMVQLTLTRLTMGHTAFSVNRTNCNSQGPHSYVLSMSYPFPPGRGGNRICGYFHSSNHRSPRLDC